MDTKILREIGLTPSQISVYLSLLKHGSSKVGSLAEELPLHRSRIYEALNWLVQKGIVSYLIKGDVKYFEATHPESLLTYLQDERARLSEKESEIKRLVPDLSRMAQFPREKAEAHVLVGKDGFKAMRRDSLRHAKGEILLIGAISREDEVMPAFYKEWNKQRQKHKIRLRILHKESARGKAMSKKAFMGRYFETKFLPKEIESPAVINIYGDRIVNVLWKDKYPLCFVIINREIADSYRKWFELLWKYSWK